MKRNDRAGLYIVVYRQNIDHFNKLQAQWTMHDYILYLKDNFFNVMYM